MKDGVEVQMRDGEAAFEGDVARDAGLEHLDRGMKQRLSHGVSRCIHAREMSNPESYAAVGVARLDLDISC